MAGKDVLTPGQETFAARVAKLTGLDHNVVRAWALAEESYTAARNRDSSKNFNYLNIGVGPSGDRFNPGWTDPVTAADNTAAFLKGEKFGPDPSITAILHTVGKDPAAQIQAIATSKWDAGHYNGGKGLQGTYSLVSGLPAPTIDTPESPAATPKKPQGITGTPEKAAQDSADTTLDTLNEPLSFLKGSSIALPQHDSKGGLALPSMPFTSLKGSSIPLPALSPPPVPDPAKAVAAAATAPKVAASPIANTILATAKSQIGTNYVWGGAAPGGFDCSGLVYWSAKQHGVTLPRTSEQQVKVGTPVASLKNAQPGDLLFYGDPGAPHHEAIYAGNGRMVESPFTGAKVRDVPVRTPVAIRRLTAKQ